MKTTILISILLATASNSQASPQAKPNPVPVIIDTQCQLTAQGQHCIVTFEGGKQEAYRIENGTIIPERGQPSGKQ
jgi:hypothetical protein